MAEFRSRMLAAYDSSLGAFAAMRGAEDHDAPTVAAEGSLAPGQTEFLGMVERFEPPLTQKQAEYAFRGLDMNSDGHLPSYEFFEVIDSGNFFPNDWMVEAVTREAMAAEPAELAEPAEPAEPAEAVAAPQGHDLRIQAVSAGRSVRQVGGVWLVLTAVLGAGMAVGALFCWAGLRALRQGPEGDEDEEDPVAGRPVTTRASILEDGSPSGRLKRMANDDVEADEFRPKNLMALFSCCGGNPRPGWPATPMPPPPRGGGFV
jgi:hypothetical protein